MKIKDLQKEDVETINYIYQHRGSCKGGICNSCIVTKLQGKVECSNDRAYEVVSKFLNMEVCI